jgi:hypothetical protein
MSLWLVCEGRKVTAAFVARCGGQALIDLALDDCRDFSLRQAAPHRLRGAQASNGAGEMLASTAIRTALRGGNRLSVADGGQRRPQGRHGNQVAGTERSAKGSAQAVLDAGAGMGCRAAWVHAPEHAGRICSTAASCRSDGHAGPDARKAAGWCLVVRGRRRDTSLAGGEASAASHTGRKTPGREPMPPTRSDRHLGSPRLFYRMKIQD